MQQKGGFWWPDSDRVGADAILAHAARHFPAVLAFVPTKGLAVQAGGNVGVYPARLAEHFMLVHTFEPEPENFACLETNLAGRDNIRRYNLALGDHAGSVGLKHHPDNAGAHRIAGAGDIGMITVDGLDLPKCDLIWLDVEGYEPEVLRGAAATIERYRPVVIVEDMGLSADGDGAARRWLHERGYRPAEKIMHDYVMVPA